MKWAIIFPDNWISYSPSIINFVTLLEANGQDYLVLHFEDGFYDNSKLSIKHFPIKENKLLTKLRKWNKLFKIYKIWLLYHTVNQFHKKKHFDRFVGIDDCGFFAAYLIKKEAIYYSLEISNRRLSRFIFKYLNVRLLIIQSKERKEFLCPQDINTVYIQNSIISPLKKIQYKSYNGRFIYFGSILPEHGVEYCINSLYSTENTTLMIKGPMTNDLQYINYLQEQYKNLIDNKRLFFDFSYTYQNDVIAYLQPFDIGFCFYDNKFIHTNDFNYISSPSGKMFNYFAAGLPIIGSDFIGLLPIVSKNAGILIKNLNNDEIVNAINIIKDNYILFQENSIKASIEFDYANMFEQNRDKILGIM
jgi:hypothetical protein